MQISCLVSQEDMFKFKSMSKFYQILMMAYMPSIMNKHVFENANVQKFLKSTDFHFDVIVAEEFYCDSLYMLAHKHQAPLVKICKS